MFKPEKLDINQEEAKAQKIDKKTGEEKHRFIYSSEYLDEQRRQRSGLGDSTLISANTETPRDSGDKKEIFAEKERKFLEKLENSSKPEDILSRFKDRYSWGIIYEEEKGTAETVRHRFTLPIRIKGQESEDFCYHINVYPQEGEIEVVIAEREDRDKPISGPKGTSAQHLSEIEFASFQLAEQDAEKRGVPIHDQAFTRIKARSVEHQRTVEDLKPYVAVNGTVNYKKDSSEKNEYIGYKTALYSIFGKSTRMLLEHMEKKYGKKGISKVEIGVEVLSFDDDFEETPSRSSIEPVIFHIASEGVS